MLARIIRESKEYAIGSGVYWDSFTAAEMTPRVLARLVRGGSVYLSGNAVVITKLGGEGSERWRQICFAAGPQKDVMKAIRHVFGRNERQRVTWKMVYAPARSPLASALSKSGFRRRGTFVLFEARSPKS